MTIPRRPPEDGHDITWEILFEYLEQDLLTPHIAFDQIYLKQPGPPGLTPRQELAERFAKNLVPAWFEKTGKYPGQALDMLIKSEFVEITKASFILADAILADGKGSDA